MRFWVVGWGCIRRCLFIKVLSSSVSTSLIFLNCNFIIFFKWINVLSCHLLFAHFVIFYYSGCIWQFMSSQTLVTIASITPIHWNTECIFEALESHSSTNKAITWSFLHTTSHALWWSSSSRSPSQRWSTHGATKFSIIEEFFFFLAALHVHDTNCTAADNKEEEDSNAWSCDIEDFLAFRSGKVLIVDFFVPFSWCHTRELIAKFISRSLLVFLWDNHQYQLMVYICFEYNIVCNIYVCSWSWFYWFTCQWIDHNTLLAFDLNSYFASSVESCRRFKNIITSFVLIGFCFSSTCFGERLPALNIAVREISRLYFFNLDFHIFWCATAHSIINQWAAHKITLLCLRKCWWTFIQFRWFAVKRRVWRRATYSVPGISKLATPTTHEVTRSICTFIARFEFTMIGMYHLD